MNVCNLIVLEYSISQKAFHRYTFGELIEKNILHIKSDKIPPDYLVIGMFLSHDACDRFFKFIEPLIRPDQVNQLSNITVDDLLSGDFK